MYEVREKQVTKLPFAVPLFPHGSAFTKRQQNTGKAFLLVQITRFYHPEAHYTAQESDFR
jgi:hypothetical protein